MIRPIKRVVIVENATTDTELTGISMAAITGDITPMRAMLTPKTLYKKEITKLKYTIATEIFVNPTN